MIWSWLQQKRNPQIEFYSATKEPLMSIIKGTQQIYNVCLAKAPHEIRHLWEIMKTLALNKKHFLATKRFRMFCEMQSFIPSKWYQNANAKATNPLFYLSSIADVIRCFFFLFSFFLSYLEQIPKSLFHKHSTRL